MPYGEPDPQDPNVLVGVSVPAELGVMREMAYAFAEEFTSMGFDEERLLALFRQPYYAGPHRAHAVLGEGEIRAIVAESVNRWGRVRAVVRAPAPRPPDPELVQIGGSSRQDAQSDEKS